jgi:hypothetical protein
MDAKRATVGLDELLGSIDQTGWARLVVSYEGKEARIELPVPEPLFDREPRIEAARRGLLDLLGALEAWERSHASIEWHSQSR